MAEREFSLRVFRFDPGQDREPRYDRFSIPLRERMTVLDALFYALEHYDPSLSFRFSCRGAVCGSCALVINGSIRLACQTQVASLGPAPVEVSPLPYLPLVKDLVVDLAPFYEKFDRIKPYLIRSSPAPEKEHRQSPRQRQRLDSVTDCIWCAACYAACPILWTDPEYLGPPALVKAYRFLVDSRDEGREERLRLVDGEQGVWRCHTIFNCVEVCPKEINQTQAIEGLRRQALRRRLGWK